MGHSCEIAVILVVWKDELEKGKKVVSVFLDLKRTFVTIYRARLFNKLDRYEALVPVLKWIKRHLDGRSQITRFGSILSKPKSKNVGIRDRL